MDRLCLLLLLPLLYRCIHPTQSHSLFGGQLVPPFHDPAASVEFACDAALFLWCMCCLVLLLLVLLLLSLLPIAAVFPSSTQTLLCSSVL